MKNKLKINIKEKWKAILCVLLVIAVLGGTFGIIFTSVKKSSAEPENEEITEPSEEASKIGLYRNATGVLKYTYYENYRFLPEDKLGFSYSGQLGSRDGLPVSTWIKVKYDRGIDPYLEIGKSLSNVNNSVTFTPVSDKGTKVVFETDFCWMGTVNGIGPGAEYDTDPTWHVQISIRNETENIMYLRFAETEVDGVFKITRNKENQNCGEYNIGEWYNLRIEIDENKGSVNDCKYKVFIDNIAVDEFSGMPASENASFSAIDNVLLDQRYYSNDSVLHLDNTYFSKR